MFKNQIMKSITLETNSKIENEVLSELINNFLFEKGIIIDDIKINEVPDTILSKRGRKPKYPFKRMEIGDVMILCDHYSRYEHQKYGNYPRNWAKKSPDCKHYRFKTYKTDDGKIATMRIA